MVRILQLCRSLSLCRVTSLHSPLKRSFRRSGRGVLMAGQWSAALHRYIWENSGLNLPVNVVFFLSSDRVLVLAVGLSVVLLLLLLGLIVYYLWRSKRMKARSQYEELLPSAPSVPACSAPVILVSQDSLPTLVPWDKRAHSPTYYQVFCFFFPSYPYNIWHNRTCGTTFKSNFT